MKLSDERSMCTRIVASIYTGCRIDPIRLNDKSFSVTTMISNLNIMGHTSVTPFHLRCAVQAHQIYHIFQIYPRRRNIHTGHINKANCDLSTGVAYICLNYMIAANRVCVVRNTRRDMFLFYLYEAEFVTFSF